MADAPASPPQAGENKSAVGARFSERPLDLDVRSSAGPYPRPRPSRGSLKKTWLAAAGAALVLALTWVLFSSHEDSPPPLPSSDMSEAASLSPEGSPPDPADRPDDLGFAPLPTQPGDQLESPANTELTAEPPTRATAATEPEDKPARTISTAPEDKPARTAASAKPAAKPADKPAQAAASAKPADKPTETAKQPAAAPPAEKPAAGTAEISDKWVVNISSTPDAAESLRFLSTLAGQDVGGRVYASEAVLEGRTQHRIRVGFFNTKEEAEAVGLKIKERYRLYATPWAVRPSKEEESKYGGGR